MKDVFGRELEAGDIVAFASKTGVRTSLRFAIVLGFKRLPERGDMVIIQSVDPWGPRYGNFRLRGVSYAVPDSMMKHMELALPTTLNMILRKAYEDYTHEQQNKLIIEKEKLDQPTAPKFRKMQNEIRTA